MSQDFSKQFYILQCNLDSIAGSNYSDNLILPSENKIHLCKTPFEQLMKKLYLERRTFKELQNLFILYLDQVKDNHKLNSIILANIIEYSKKCSEEIIENIETCKDEKEQDLHLGILNLIEEKQKNLEEISKEVDHVTQLCFSHNSKQALPIDFNSSEDHTKKYQETIYSNTIIKEFIEQVRDQYSCQEVQDLTKAYVEYQKSKDDDESSEQMQKKTNKRRRKQPQRQKQSEAQPCNEPEQLVKNEQIDEVKQFEHRLEAANQNLQEDQKLKPNLSKEWVKKFQQKMSKRR